MAADLLRPVGAMRPMMTEPATGIRIDQRPSVSSEINPALVENVP